MTYTLDTSGSVSLPDPDRRAGVVTVDNVIWTDLTPFQQGYVEGLLSHVCEQQVREALAAGSYEQPQPYGFSDLAPEALALILKDCEEMKSYCAAAVQDSPETGAEVWRSRSQGLWAQYGFPPLAVTLGDGKVYLK